MLIGFCSCYPEGLYETSEAEHGGYDHEALQQVDYSGLSHRGLVLGHGHGHGHGHEHGHEHVIDYYVSSSAFT